MHDAILMQAAPHVAAGRIPQALAILRRALEKNPANYPLLDKTVDLLCKTKQYDQANFLVERAAQLVPADRKYMMLAGDIEMKRERFGAASKFFWRAFEIDPTDIEPLRAGCIAMYQDGRFEEAMGTARRLYTERPGDIKALALYSGFCDLAGDLNEMVRVLIQALERAPSDAAILSALLLPLTRLHGVDPRLVFHHHVRMGQLVTEMAPADNRPHANIPDPERPLRIGYCSQDFRNRSAGHFIEPIIANHDKSMFHVTLYHNVISEDELTARLRKHAARYIDTHRVDDKKMVDFIRNDRIDILVDLSGHTGMGRIVPFVLKPAPIQYTYMGYPNTTGLPTMDFRIVDAFTDPPGSDHLATEKLVRMEGSFLCYTPPPHASEPAPPPSVKNGYVTFGSFNTLTKISNHVLDVWADLLLQVPGSRLFLKSMALAMPATRERVWTHLAAKGVERSRVDLEGETKGKGEHMQMYSRIDVGLDTWPYNGTTTTVEAMYMGVPVVTIAGNSHVSRVGVSLLSNTGLPDLIASDEADYLKKCIQIGQDEARRIELRTKLRSMVTGSVLCDHAGFTRRLEAHYRQSWRDWCARKRANPAL
ncbi:MAG: tetratricopeptide repeat protein [Phycisphaeraceae bacterium]|nr:tetratricopeptide repeat protein [Phycisphaeraceae bacterium]